MAIQVRQGPAASFNPANLLSGEMAYATDTHHLFVGHGDGTADDFGTDLQGQIDSLQINNRNILLNSAVSQDNLSKYIVSNSTLSAVVEDNFNCFKIVAGNTSNGSIGISGSDVKTNAILIPGVPYTYSFWIKSDMTQSATDINGCLHFVCINGTNYHTETNIAENNNNIVPNVWTKVSCTFYVKEQSHFVPYIWYLAPGSTTYIRDISVVQNNKAGDGTPAPEDIQLQIANCLKVPTHETINGWDVTKYSDGHVVAYKTLTVAADVNAWTDWNGQKERSDIAIGYLPYTFKNPPHMQIICTSGVIATVESVVGTTTTNAGTFGIFRPNAAGYDITYDIRIDGYI